MEDGSKGRARAHVGCSQTMCLIPIFFSYNCVLSWVLKRGLGLTLCFLFLWDGHIETENHSQLRASQRTREEPTAARGEHAHSTQEAGEPSFTSMLIEAVYSTCWSDTKRDKGRTPLFYEEICVKYTNMTALQW